MTCVIIGGISHVMFTGIGVTDSTGCGKMAGEGYLRIEGETDCMACIAHKVLMENLCAELQNEIKKWRQDPLHIIVYDEIILP